MAFITHPVGASPSLTHATPQHAVGTLGEGNNGAKFIYCKASTTIPQYYAAGVDEDFQANPLSSTMAAAGMAICWPQVAVPISEYFWGQMEGRGVDMTIVVAASCAADTALYTTATPGVLDDSATATQSLVEGVVIVTTQASTTGLASGTEAIVTYPRSK
jgi:hypothetical protein